MSETINGSEVRRVGPRLSIVVCAYDMADVIGNTIHSLSPDYQRGVGPADYEVVVIDNGSSVPVNSDLLESHANMRLIRIARADARPSPVQTINEVVATTTGKWVGLMMCGARIVTPGLVRTALDAFDAEERRVVGTLGWYLGHDLQRYSIKYGHTHQREIELLRSINWPDDGYALFDIGTLDDSSADGWIAGISESNTLFMSRRRWDRLGGLDQQFTSPGGGFANLDLFHRAVSASDGAFVLLVGEASFHQCHDGIATNAPVKGFADRLEAWREEYRELRGAPYRRPEGAPLLFGTIPKPLTPRLALALAREAAPAVELRIHPPAPRSLFPSTQPDDVSTRLVERMYRAMSEGCLRAAAAVARLGHGHYPDDPELRRWSALLANYHAGELEAEVLLALGDAFLILRQIEKARVHFDGVLRLDPENEAARGALARLRMPGLHYLGVLRLLHQCLRPRIYLEIGVFKGASLELARPPTKVVAVDPEPQLRCAPRTETRLHTVTSDAFFSRAHTGLEGSVDLAFIDGDHTFGQVFRDVAHVSHVVAEGGVIVLHDTIPFDEVSARPRFQPGFWTGDVWKIVPMLRAIAPHARIATVGAPPSGLTLVSGLPRLDADDYHELMMAWANADYADHRPSVGDADALGSSSEAIRSWLFAGQSLVAGHSAQAQEKTS